MQFDWRNPDYAPVYRERIERLERLRAEPSLLPALKEYYKTHPVQFINDWCLTSDPRNAEIGLPVQVPFLLFTKQVEFIEWMYARWLAREDGVGEKSRDMGVSWLCVAFAVWMWLFYPGIVFGFGSRKETYVDENGNPSSLFWKIRFLIDSLPPEFRPAGWNSKLHAPYMRIINPENDSTIIGEAGDNIGRGGRTSVYVLDEAAFIERADNVDAALSQTSNCKLHVSTPNGNGNAFYRKRHGGKLPVFSFRWEEDPRKDQAWYEKQKATLDPVIVAQEIDIDYNASVADAFITGESITNAQRNGPADVEPLGGWIVGVDAAHFGDDESVIHMRRGRLNLPQVTRRGIDGLQLAAVVSEECAKLERAGKHISAVVIELDGPGVSCYDQLMSGRYQEVVVGVHTGARQSDDKNYNLKARMWRNLRDYLDIPPVCLPNDPELRSQLASVRYNYKQGLLLMQAKKDYKGDYGKSPDRADAFALTFAVDMPPDDEAELDRYARSRYGKKQRSSYMSA